MTIDMSNLPEKIRRIKTGVRQWEDTTWNWSTQKHEKVLRSEDKYDFQDPLIMQIIRQMIKVGKLMNPRYCRLVENGLKKGDFSLKTCTYQYCRAYKIEFFIKPAGDQAYTSRSYAEILYIPKYKAFKIWIPEVKYSTWCPTYHQVFMWACNNHIACVNSFADDDILAKSLQTKTGVLTFPIMFEQYIRHGKPGFQARTL